MSDRESSLCFVLATGGHVEEIRHRSSLSPWIQNLNDSVVFFLNAYLFLRYNHLLYKILITDCPIESIERLVGKPKLKLWWHVNVIQITWKKIFPYLV